MEIINYALWKFVYKNFVEYKMHLSKILTISFIHQVQDSCRIRIHHSARNKESSRSSRKKKSRGWEYGKRSFRKQLGNREEESKYPSCGGFKKKKKCLPAPGYPQAGFPEANMRINYEPCSNSRTEGCKGGEGKIGHPYYSRTITILSRSVSPHLSFFLLFLSSPRRASSPPPPLSLSFIFFFFISHSRLCLTSVAEFFRSTAIITPRRWKRKTGVENSEWCKGVVTATTRGEKRFEEIVWKFLDNSVGGTPYAIFRLAFFFLSLKGCFRYIQPFHPLLISV